MDSPHVNTGALTGPSCREETGWEGDHLQEGPSLAFLHSCSPLHAGTERGSGHGQACLRLEAGDGGRAWLPLAAKASLARFLSTCSPAAAWPLPHLPASLVCRPPVPNICREDLLDACFLFVLGATQSSCFILMGFLFRAIVSTALFICFPSGPSHVPFLPLCQPVPLPFSPALGPRLWYPRALLPLLGNLAQTRCGFLLLFLLFPPDWPRAAGLGWEERLCSPNPALPTLLPCPALRPLPKKGRRAVHPSTLP